MVTIILSIIILAVVITAMAVGVIFSGKPIKGSCGGMAAVGIDKACDICGGHPKKCEEEQERISIEARSAMIKSLTYDASKKTP